MFTDITMLHHNGSSGHVVISLHVPVAQRYVTHFIALTGFRPVIFELSADARYLSQVICTEASLSSSCLFNTYQGSCQRPEYYLYLDFFHQCFLTIIKKTAWDIASAATAQSTLSLIHRLMMTAFIVRTKG